MKGNKRRCKDCKHFDSKGSIFSREGIQKSVIPKGNLYTRTIPIFHPKAGKKVRNRRVPQTLKLKCESKNLSIQTLSNVVVSSSFSNPRSLKHPLTQHSEVYSANRTFSDI